MCEESKEEKQYEAKVELINQILRKDDFHWVFIHVPTNWLVQNPQSEVIIESVASTADQLGIVSNAKRQLISQNTKEQSEK